MVRSWMGRAEIEPAGEFIAGSHVTLTLTYHVGEFVITFFLIVQYAVTILFLIKRIERLRDAPPPILAEPERT